MKNAVAVFLIVLGVVVFVALLGGAMSYGGFGMMGGMMGRFGSNPLGHIVSLFAWVLLIGGGVWLVARLARNGNLSMSGSGNESPLDILKMRYAKGEITKKQFDAMKRDIV